MVRDRLTLEVLLRQLAFNQWLFPRTWLFREAFTQAQLAFAPLKDDCAQVVKLAEKTAVDLSFIYEAVSKFFVD